LSGARGVKEMTPIRKEARPAMRILTPRAVECCYGPGLTALGWNAVKASRALQAGYDFAIRAPRSSAMATFFGEDLRRSPGNTDAFQLPCAKNPMRRPSADQKG
jgi:hypothetical protein